MREVVHTRTQYEYDYVNEKLNYKWLENKWTDERENTCIRLDDRAYSGLMFYKMEGYKIISFNEFKSRYEPQLKIGDTFEKDGFVCRVESEVVKWVYNTTAKAYYKTKTNHTHEIVIRDQEFINQLEKFAK